MTDAPADRSAPMFSVLMPAYRTPPDLLSRAIASVVAQTFPSWELVVVDDGSPGEDVAATVAAAAAADPRVQLVRRSSNGGIGVASADGLARCRGAWLALMDHDDLLEPDALEACATAIHDRPTTDVVYTDEDWVDMADQPLGPFLKPDWSPERLRAQQYVNHLCCYRRSLVDEVGGFRAGFDGSQDYDLVLRATERARHVEHVPHVLYHWRVRPGQVSGTGDPAVYEAARRAITEHCERTGRPAEVEQVDPLGIYRVRYRLPRRPLVSVVIPTRGSSGIVHGSDRVFVVEAVRSVVERSTYPDVEFVVVADRVMDTAIVQELQDLTRGRTTVVWYGGRFDFSHKINLGAGAARGRYMVMLNDDTEVVTPDWLEVMLGHAMQADVGMVGATLLFEDGTLQHAGHLYLGPAAIGHVGYGALADEAGPVSALRMDRECSGVTAACAMVDRAVFFEVGGMSRQFPVNYNDVDLSLKIRRTGRRIVCTPWAVLHHYESKTRVAGIGSAELHSMEVRWGHELRSGDPYWRYPDSDWVVTDPGGSTASSAR